MKPYRTPPTTPARELVFEPAPLAATAHSRLVPVPVLVVAVLVAVVGSFVIDRLAGLLGFLVTLAVGFAVRRRPAQLVLRVENEALTITRGKASLLTSSLEELHDVALDTRTIRPVGQATGMVSHLRMVQTSVGPEVDRSRIVVVTKGGQLPLCEEEIAHTEAVEWMARVRTFLRRAGWVPLDERA